jgi:pimeloyl-ACP methyl ester carboxylesterase
MRVKIPKRCRQAVLILLLSIFSIPSLVNAQILVEELPTGVGVNANFHAGDPANPAILLLHGFLTTYDFSAVHGIFDLLADKNYTVVAPNLSLGINQRMSGLRCDAIHIHNMEEDLQEVAWWVDWLAKRGHRKIILIGHAMGSLQLVAYAAHSPNNAVKLVIATGLVPFIENVSEMSTATTKSDEERAQKLADKGDISLDEYSISYCNDNFVAPAGVFLSYIQWTEKQVLQAVRNAIPPIKVILAGKDPRFGKRWPNALSKAGASVTIVDNASHFFDDEYAVELHNRIDSFIENLNN